MRRFTSTTGSLILLSLLALSGAHAAALGDANSDGVVSVADGVQILRAASGLSSACATAACDLDGNEVLSVTDAVSALRLAGDLPAAAARVAAAGAAGSTVDVAFHLEAATALDGYQIEVAYPLAKGGFAGSADGVECTAPGGAIFIANDRDDGSLVLIEAWIVPLTFPRVVTCRFVQAAGSTLESTDLGVTVVEVVENGATGDPADLTVAASVVAPPPVCTDGRLDFSTVFGGALDLGWTGIAHDQPLPSGVRTSLPLTCAADDPLCTIDGAPLAGQPLGAPIPISAGGVPTCVVPRLTTAPTGTVDCDTGCTSATLTLEAKVYLTLDRDHPCPRCAGDVAANDGVQDGTCLEGATPGAACDAHGATERLGTTGPDDGTTSRDCPPSGASVGEPILTLDPLTTGSSTLHANVDCLSDAFPPGSCHCTAQVAPNACIPDGVCGLSGFCENNPPDGVCSEQLFRACDLTAGNRDCEDTFPGAGACIAMARPCFGPAIESTGFCGGADAALTSVFCVANTRSAAVNTVYGFPGPAVLHVPVRYGAAPGPTATPPSTPRATPTPNAPTATPTPRPGDCDPVPRGACAGLGARDSVLTIRNGRATELSWRWTGGTVAPPTDFGRPDFDTGYAVCVYAAPIPGPTPGAPIAPLVFQATVPANAYCNGVPCWKPTRTGGWLYRNRVGQHDGVTRIALGHDRDGGAGIVVKVRKGDPASLPLPTAPIVELQATNGTCWSEVFEHDEVVRNDFKRFRARSRAR